MGKKIVQTNETAVKQSEQHIIFIDDLKKKSAIDPATRPAMTPMAPVLIMPNIAACVVVILNTAC
ncbi:TPA: hypothetical protein ACIBGC_005085, partial [Salmonella enterica subsp. enterica serovar Eastbourne]